MSIRKPVAIATSVAALLCASSSFAQETVQPLPPPSTTTTTTQPQPVQTTTTTQPPVAQPQGQATTTTIVQPVPASTTQTTAAPYYPAQVGSDRYTERKISHRPNRALLSTGTSLFVLTYGGSVIAGAVSDRDEDKRLFIPLVGPWLDLGQRNCSATTPCGDNEDLAKAMIVSSGVVQGAGVLLALGSLIIPETTKVEERTTTAKAKVEKPSVKVLPVSFVAGAGVGAVGRF